MERVVDKAAEAEWLKLTKKVMDLESQLFAIKNERLALKVRIMQGRGYWGMNDDALTKLIRAA